MCGLLIALFLPVRWHRDEPVYEQSIPSLNTDEKTGPPTGFGAGYRRITDKQQLLEALQTDISGKQPMVYEVDESDAFLSKMSQDFTYFG